jgi:antitoxin component YwqK of YwqJK toxin-antitoxin module
MKLIAAAFITIFSLASLVFFSRSKMLVKRNTDCVADASLLKTHRGITSIDNVPFSGMAYLITAEGDTTLRESYLNGKLNGMSKAWYPNAQLRHERLYKNGKKEGVHLGWWPNGQLKFKYEFENDEHHGSAVEWYESGLLFKQFSYKYGYEQGSQKMWRLDGSVYANYFVKNNRIYGLSGRKNCKALGKV